MHVHGGGGHDAMGGGDALDGMAGHLLRHGVTSFLPTAWGYDHAEETNRMMFPADDPWPYGIENNRKTLEPFLAFCHEQGVTRRKLAVEELFPKEVSFALKI